MKFLFGEHLTKPYTWKFHLSFNLFFIQTQTTSLITSVYNQHPSQWQWFYDIREKIANNLQAIYKIFCLFFAYEKLFFPAHPSAESFYKCYKLELKAVCIAYNIFSSFCVIFEYHWNEDGLKRIYSLFQNLMLTWSFHFIQPLQTYSIHVIVYETKEHVHIPFGT